MNTAFCDTCGAQCPASQQSSIPDGGWTLPIDRFGGYGLFDDNIDVAFGKTDSRWLNMCHDCVVKFLTMFPMVGEVVGMGCHPNNIHLDDWVRTDEKDGTLDKPCCQWAWCWKELGDGNYETYYGTANGEWKHIHTSSDSADSELKLENE